MTEYAKHFNISALARRALYQQVRTDLLKGDYRSLENQMSAILFTNLAIKPDSHGLGLEAQLPRRLAKGVQIVLNHLTAERPSMAMMLATHLTEKLKHHFEPHRAIDIDPVREFLQPTLIALSADPRVQPHIRAEGLTTLLSNPRFTDEKPEHLEVLRNALPLLTTMNDVPKLLTTEEPPLCVSLINAASAALEYADDDVTHAHYAEVYETAVAAWEHVLARLPATKALLHVNEAEFVKQTPRLEEIRQNVAARHVAAQPATSGSSPA